MADDEEPSDETEEIDDDRSQYGGAPSDIDASEQTERAEDATDQDDEADRDAS